MTTTTLTNESAREFLIRDGNLRVPCSRYGWDTESCIPVAIAFANVLVRESDSGFTEETVDYAMRLVVNDHDDVLYLIREYGTDAERELVADIFLLHEMPDE